MYCSAYGVVRRSKNERRHDDSNHLSSSWHVRQCDRWCQLGKNAQRRSQRNSASDCSNFPLALCRFPRERSASDRHVGRLGRMGVYFLRQLGTTNEHSSEQRTSVPQKECSAVQLGPTRIPRLSVRQCKLTFRRAMHQIKMIIPLVRSVLSRCGKNIRK